MWAARSSQNAPPRMALHCVHMSYMKCNPQVLKWLSRPSRFPRSRKQCFPHFTGRWRLELARCSPRAGLGEGRAASAGGKVTCGAVHHVGRHAVGRRLRVHQPRAVVHGLAVGRAGSHESALVHAREAALPVRRESTCICTLTTHRRLLPWWPFLGMHLCKGRASLVHVCLKSCIFWRERERG